MKLKFQKNEKNEIFVKIGEKDFSTDDYIKMIKDVRNHKKIEADFEGSISGDEQDSVLSMLNEINNIGENDDYEGDEKDTEEISVENIPF